MRYFIRYRQSLRLKDYDYSQNGAYFITICTQNRECLFGSIVNGKMQLNDAGKMVQNWIKKLPEKFPNVILDEYIIMPNHLHMITMIENQSVEAKPCFRPGSDNYAMGDYMESPLRVPNSYDGLGRYISWFKRMSTNQYINAVKSENFLPFNKRLWQRNYYEHVIRNKQSFEQIREYVIYNPASWEKDKLNFGKNQD
jgi:putative transposase